MKPYPLEKKCLKKVDQNTDPDQGLRKKMVDTAITSAGMRLIKENTIPACQLKPSGEDWVEKNKGAIDNCYKASLIDIKQPYDEKTEEALIITASENIRNSNLLSNTQTLMIGTMGLAVGIGTIAGVANIDTGVDIGDIIRFYFGIGLVKMFMQFFQPLALMIVYIFWAWFMIISAYSTKAMIKGSLIIIVLSILPGIWAIADHLDEALYRTMFETTAIDYLQIISETGPSGVGAKIGGGMVSQIFFDIVMTLFYILMPSILIWFIAQADGPDLSRVNSENANSSTQGASAGGRLKMPKISKGRSSSKGNEPKT